MKIKNSIGYLALTIVAAAALFFIMRTQSLQQQLVASETQRAELTEQLTGYEELVQIDSILLQGDYNTALESYTATLNTAKEQQMGIPLRIALAEKLLHDKNSSIRTSKAKDSIDEVLENETPGNPDQIRQYDSLNFTLQKTKVQLARLKRQLKNKSFGEYLRFKSEKGNQLHYVGQVKRGKADGFGIALLDSGSRYEGQWADNKRHGEGTFYWPDGEYYVGTYENDKRSGFGTYYWPNGEKYAGEWKEDKRSGSGEFYGTDGDVLTAGEWNDDKLVEVNKK